MLAQPPAFLERLALRLLKAMGYGSREALLEHTGKSGDAGLDGLVRQDALGLELVGVQAKRHDKKVSRGGPRGFEAANFSAVANCDPSRAVTGDAHQPWRCCVTGLLIDRDATRF